jgi:hypothetical protein
VLSLLRASIQLRERAHHARFERATAHPEAAQAACLRSLMERNTDTTFGRDHGFSRIAGPVEYARRVPIRDYEGFRPYVNRVIAGEERVLTTEPPVMFTTTSGTTGQPKLIPVTTSWREQMASLTRLWMFCLLRDHPGCLDRKSLTVVSPAIEGLTAGGLPYGAMSGVLYERIPWLVRRQYAVPYAVYLVSDCDARYWLTMRFALAHSVSVVGAPNPSSLIRLVEAAGDRSEEIVRAIRDGTLGIPVPEGLDKAARAGDGGLRGLEARLRPDPERARVLARILERDGALSPKNCWPHLALIACWLGGSAGIHARRLAEYYGADVPLRDLGLLASEGRLTIPIEDDSPAGVLAVHANFYEFIPEERIEDPSPPIVLAHALEDGKRYYIILSGGNGLYRYDLNDIVEVRGFHQGTPKVAFVRKGRDMANITGEKLHVNQVQAAIRRAEERTGLDVWQFRLIPDVDASRYDLLVERREGLPGDPTWLGFLAAFDEELASLNVEYAAKRASRRLGAPRLHLMRPGWSERLSRAEFRNGKREVQYKWAAIRLEWDAASREEVIRTLDPAADPHATVRSSA